ncbi:MAG: DUF1674 domain-containing protein [Pseudomonadota bacterium]
MSKDSVIETQLSPDERRKRAAARAKQEAEARRKAIDAKRSDAAREIDGRGGLDPVRYDDWEIKGLTADF